MAILCSRDGGPPYFGRVVVPRNGMSRYEYVMKLRFGSGIDILQNGRRLFVETAAIPVSLSFHVALLHGTITI